MTPPQVNHTKALLIQALLRTGYRILQPPHERTVRLARRHRGINIPYIALSDPFHRIQHQQPPLSLLPFLSSREEGRRKARRAKKTNTSNSTTSQPFQPSRSPLRGEGKVGRKRGERKEDVPLYEYLQCLPFFEVLSHPPSSYYP